MLLRGGVLTLWSIWAGYYLGNLLSWQKTTWMFENILVVFLKNLSFLKDS